MKTILLVFVHGFKGGSDTFESFPEDLEAQLNKSRTSDAVEYQSVVYPPYETHGDFTLAVSKLREFLTNKVIDIEAMRGTSSPTINGSVKVILLGHSMGGLVAADVVLDIHAEYTSAMMFPHILGIVCLDSPMLGLAPTMWTNSADGLFQKGKSFYETAAGISAIGTGLFASKVVDQKQKVIEQKPTSASSYGWKSLAAIGAASAVAVGGALYSQKDTIGRGFQWITGHLAFVSVLRKAEELSQRTVKVNSIEDIDFTLYYTELTPTGILPRTFISLPKGDALKARFHAQRNANAVDEVAAHTTMFSNSKNSGYNELRDNVCLEIGQWTARRLNIPQTISSAFVGSVQ